jgi:hypothetical protein
VTAARGDELGRGRVKDELEYLAALAAHVNSPAVLEYRHDRHILDAPAEVQDPRPRADLG